MSFVHLHVHSGYSLDSVIKIDELVQTARAMNMPAVALTDHGHMFGLKEFYKAARAVGVKPILGVEVNVVHDLHRLDPNDLGHHLVLLAKNLEGYLNLRQLVSLANREGNFGQPRVDKKLLATHSQGIIALSACLQGEIPSLILEGRSAEARSTTEEYARLFPDCFYLELQNHGIPAQAVINAELMEITRALDLPLVAANDCHYLEKEQSELHDILLCGRTGATVVTRTRLRFPSPEYYFKSASEMAAAFPHLPEALANTLAIAERCQVEFSRSSQILAHAERCEKVIRLRLPEALAVAARALGLNEDEVGLLTDLARQDRKSLFQVAEVSPGVAKLLVLAAELENLPSHFSTPVTGLAIADRPQLAKRPIKS